MCRFLISYLVFIIPMAFFAQENIPIKELLNEAKTKLYSQPEQAGKIASYIISQKESNTIYAQATLLLAKSYYVRGNYNDAVKNAMNARKLADASADVELKIETILFALKLSRKLNLATVAKNYFSDLISLQKELLNKNLALRLEGKLKQDSALVLFQNGNYNQSIKEFRKAESIFATTNDSISQSETNISLAEVLMQSGQLESAKIQLEKFPKPIQSDFEKLQILIVTGKLDFNNKDYQKAITTFQKALDLSLKLPNKIYENLSLEGLTVSYLALEDTKNFFSYKQQNNLISTEIETDKNQAINSVYNFINSYQNELAQKEIQESYSFIYILVGLLFILFIVGSGVNYLYTSKTREYLAIYKYISPKETVPVSQAKIVDLKKSSIVPEETENILLQKLNIFESGKKYTNPDMSIALLASQFDTNTKYLSEVINRQKDKNFNAYINELRINYIIDKLKTDPVYFNYKVSYLAEESGFSSHSSFATVFKSVTGISPTKFMAFLQQRQEAT